MVQHGYTPRRSAGLAAYENVLARAGLAPVAGIDEAGRGACAGPLVVAAVVLDQAGDQADAAAWPTPSCSPPPPARTPTRTSCGTRSTGTWSRSRVTEIDGFGLHVCNVEGMRRAFAGLRSRAGYVLTDGFPVQRPWLARAGDVEGRPGGRVGRRGVDRGQGDQGPDDAGAR